MIKFWKKKIRKEEGAIALLTIAFLAFFFTVALTVLWTITQLLGASALLQNTAQTAAYAASNSSSPGDSTKIDCLGTATSPHPGANPGWQEHFLCTEINSPNSLAISAAERVFEVALAPGTPATFGLCYSRNYGDTVCDNRSRVRLRARSGSEGDESTHPDPEKASVKVFNISDSSAKACRIYDAGGGKNRDRDLGYDPNKTAPGESNFGTYLCWVFSESRNYQGSSGFFYTKKFFYRTSGVIVRARANLALPLISLIGPTISIEASAAASRGQALPPRTPGEY